MLVPEVKYEFTLPTLDNLEKKLEEELAGAVEITTGRMEEQAKIHAPRDTGFLANSIFSVLHSKSGYELAVSMAKAHRQDGVILPEPEKPSTPFESILAAGAEYTIFVELGHMSRRGNTKRLGKRQGRIGVAIREGETPFYDAGFYTFTPGRLFMAGAAMFGREILPKEVLAAIKRAKS